MSMNIKVYYRTLKDLHGESTSEEALYELVSDELNLPFDKVKRVLEDYTIPAHAKAKEYGLIIGRFQPFHYGHQHIINEVLLDGRIPLIILGDDHGVNPVRNPLSVKQRKELIKLIYPNAEIIFGSVSDNPNWTEWWESMGHTVIGGSGRVKEQITLYYNHKEQDRYDHFEVNGKEYINEFYTKVFEEHGIKTKKVEFVERTDIVVDADATNIRDNLEAFKHLLDARVYWKLKEWGW